MVSNLRRWEMKSGARLVMLHQDRGGCQFYSPIVYTLIYVVYILFV